MLDRLKAAFTRQDPKPKTVVKEGGASLAPAVALACGAGVALWWWMQWVRTRDEAATPSKLDPGPVVGPAVLDGLNESLAVQADGDGRPVAHPVLDSADTPA